MGLACGRSFPAGSGAAGVWQSTRGGTGPAKTGRRSPRPAPRNGLAGMGGPAPRPPTAPRQLRHIRVLAGADQQRAQDRERSSKPASRSAVGRSRLRSASASPIMPATVLRTLGIDHLLGVPGGVCGGRHRAGQVVQVDQSGGVATFAGELTAMASVRSTGPVSTANTRRRADQARASRGSAVIGACTRASSSRTVSALGLAYANSARSCSAVRSGVRVRSSVNGRYPMGRGRRARERAPGWWLCSFAPRQHGIEGVGSASPPPGGRSRSTSAGSPAGSRRGVAPPVTGPELRRIRALLRRQRLAPLRGGEVLRSAGALVGALRGAGGSNRSSCTGGAVMVATSSSTGGKFQPRSAASIGHRAASRGVSVRPPVPHVGGHGSGAG